MIVKSILQWRERQSESFGERILQALKGPGDPPFECMQKKYFHENLVPVT